MLSLPKVKIRIKEGDRLIGVAHVTCPDCATRSYAIYIHVGKSGWYAELFDEEALNLFLNVINDESTNTIITDFENQISSERRITIK